MFKSYGVGGGLQHFSVFGFGVWGFWGKGLTIILLVNFGREGLHLSVTFVELFFLNEGFPKILCLAKL